MKDLTKDITGIELFTTRSCNMRCTYCYEKKDKNSVFSNETSKSVLELIKSNPNIKNIDLFGGESLLPEVKDNIMGFLQELKDIRTDISFYIITNAYEIEKVLDILDYIKDNFDELGIQISLDGSKNAQDMCRIDINKNGTFDKVFQNTIMLLEKYKDIDNVRINIHHVISLENIKYIIETVCLDNKLSEMYPDLKISYNSEHSINTKAHNKEFLIEVLEFLHNLYINNDLKPYIWDQFIHVDDYFQKDQPRCGLMDKFITVDIDGNLNPCHFFNKYHNHNYYNINTKEFNTENYKKSMKFIKENNIISELGYDCNSCVSKGFCPYCAASSYIETSYKSNNIIGSTACSYANTIGEWVINKYNDGIKEEARPYKLEILYETMMELTDKLERDKSHESLQEFLFYRIKCKINGIYEI